MKRTLKKLFLNISAVLLTLSVTAGAIAGENAAQIHSFLGTSGSKVVSADGSEDYPRYFESSYTSVAQLKQAGEEMVRQAEAEGIVLMKNSGVLPYAEGERLCLLGVTALDPVYGGTGSGSVSAEGWADYREVLTQAGFTVTDQALLDGYAAGDRHRTPQTIGEIPWTELDLTTAGEHAVYVIGRVGGEGNDVGKGIEDTLDGDYLHLNEAELSMINGLKQLRQQGQIASVAVVINSANPISMDFVDDDIDAVLWVGTVGQTGLYALGDVLSGRVDPSGSLPDTWWVDNRLNPVQKNFGVSVYENAEDYDFPAAAASYTRYTVYQEGIYVGYRYTETRYEDMMMGSEGAGDFSYEQTVAFPFGFGLSYTSFAFSDLQAEKTGQGNHAEYQLSVTVTNTGSCTGRKAVQIYAQKPYTDYDRENLIEKASAELVGFSKTKLLAPGEAQTLTISVPEYYLTSFDAYDSEVFILDEGTYYLTAADNAHAAVQNILAAKGVDAGGDPSAVLTLEYEFDSTTYAEAYGTGEEVWGMFWFADMNRYDGAGDNKLVYISRSDWESSVTDEPVVFSMNDIIHMDLLLDEGDLPDADEAQWPVMGQDAGLMLIEMKDVPYDDPRWDTFLDQLTYEQMARICANGLRSTIHDDAIGKPATVDHNGPAGVTQKYSYGPNGYAAQTGDPDGDQRGTAWPCSGILAATMDPELIERCGELLGEDAMWAGYAGLYGPGLNIHRSPYAGRAFEYYSEDGTLTGLIAAAQIRGIQSRGVYAYSKHFVLNEQEENRAGLSTWCNEQALREIYLRAFELPIVYADAKCVMSAFNRLGPIWAGASPELMTEWLRNEAGMTGFAVTDMFDASYMVKVNEVAAGNDIPDGYVGDDLREFEAYGLGAESENPAIAQALRTSCHRVLYIVANSRGMDGIYTGSRIVSVTAWWQQLLTAAVWISGLMTAAAAIVLLTELRKERDGH